MKRLIEKLELFFKRNGSTILTVLGAVGVIGTAVSAVMATPKAMKHIEEKKKEKGEKLTKTEIIKVAAKDYIPAACIGFGTISCILGAHTLNKKQQAALSSLYALVDGSYKNYRNKVKEIFGESTDNNIVSVIAKDRYNNDELPKKEDGVERFMDFYSLQIVDSTIEEIESAEKFVKEVLKMRGYVFLNEYFTAMGMPCIDSDFETGWSMRLLEEHGYNSLEFTNEKIEMDDGENCYVITMNVDPTPNCLF